MFVFISYSHVDQEAARAIANVLESTKVRYFLDEHIEWGADITEEVARAIGKASHVLVVVSPASLKSGWVAYEVGRADARGCVVLPYLVHPSLDLPPYLKSLKHIGSHSEILEYLSSRPHNELPLRLELIAGHVVGEYCGVSLGLPTKGVSLVVIAEGDAGPPAAVPGIWLNVTNVGAADLQLLSPQIDLKNGAKYTALKFPTFGSAFDERSVKPGFKTSYAIPGIAMFVDLFVADLVERIFIETPLNLQSEVSTSQIEDVGRYLRRHFSFDWSQLYQTFEAWRSRSVP